MKPKLIIAAVCLAVAGLTVPILISSCKNTGQKASDEAIEKTVENATGKDVEVNSNNETMEISTNDGKVKYDGNIKSWPDDIPAEVPEFTYCKIDGATISDVDNKIAYTFKIMDLNIDALKAYDKDLKAKGFESILMLIGEKGGTITAEKDGLSVALMGGDGNGTLSVQIPKK
ncbi:MAG TPA: hypothetical protein PKH58_13885 [Paludibacteraceae bacterium]|nr:hypothetical protein [Paludibacteraceae bacterium]